MEKRRVTVRVGGQVCSFVSDDPDEYISALERRANAVMKQTAGFAGTSVSMNAILSVVSLTDSLMRLEKEKTGTNAAELQAEIQKLKRAVSEAYAHEEVRKPKKIPVRDAQEDRSQVTVWELLEDPSQISVWDLLDNER